MANWPASAKVWVGKLGDVEVERGEGKTHSVLTLVTVCKFRLVQTRSQYVQAKCLFTSPFKWPKWSPVVLSCEYERRNARDNSRRTSWAILRWIVSVLRKNRRTYFQASDASCKTILFLFHARYDSKNTWTWMFPLRWLAIDFLPKCRFWSRKALKRWYEPAQWNDSGRNVLPLRNVYFHRGANTAKGNRCSAWEQVWRGMWEHKESMYAGTWCQ